ncbi:hypothetical protein F5148DRAFT_1154487 [Russula earlei]|uniref:Uncharacterized protein n=1 Tax=Russula earlei TaxID=71964 RepID=A0ACC0TRJ0_9AGAM|nr:hypothetical protein F5148DRAFT_1154487 [Russula earlei]
MFDNGEMKEMINVLSLIFMHSQIVIDQLSIHIDECRRRIVLLSLLGVKILDSFVLEGKLRGLGVGSVLELCSGIDSSCWARYSLEMSQLIYEMSHFQLHKIQGKIEWTFLMQKGEECKLTQSLSGLDGLALAFQILGWAKAIKKLSLWPGSAQPILAWLGPACGLRPGWAKHYSLPSH